jgi:hypothetical protein
MAMQEEPQQIGPGYQRRPTFARGRPVRRYREEGRAQDGGLGAMDAERLATALGWFSIGLGLAEVVTPGSVARLVGVTDDDSNRRALPIPAAGPRTLKAGLGRAAPAATRIPGEGCCRPWGNLSSVRAA